MKTKDLEQTQYDLASFNYMFEVLGSPAELIEDLTALRLDYLELSLAAELEYAATAHRRAMSFSFTLASIIDAINKVTVQQ